MVKPLVSVVIPSYNHARFIGEAVKSALGQTVKDLEVVVVDDGSSDETLQVLSRIKDDRLKIFSQENKGAHEALNRGIALSSGEFISILNSDDVYASNRIERLLAVVMEQPELGVVGTYIEVIDAEGNHLGIKRAYHSLEPWLLEHPERSFRATSDLRAALLTENYFATTSNFFARRAIFERVGGFFPLRYAHDWDFLLRASRLYPLGMVEAPLLRYRVHSSNTIRENESAMVFEILWCLATHLPKHLADKSWLDPNKRDSYLERLLYSIYAFGCEHVLVSMQAQLNGLGLDAHIEMLNHNSTLRAAYMRYIQEQLESQRLRRDKAEFAQSKPRHFVQQLAIRLRSFLRKFLFK